jgi:hypothetical protein
MAKSIPGQLSMWDQTTCEGSSSATSSPVSAAGVLRCALPAGLTLAWRGPAPALASHSVAQARAEGRRTRVTFGRSSAASFASAALQLSLESRLRARLDGHGSLVFALTLKHWPIAQQAPICAVRARAHSTSDSGSGSWPTPTVNDAVGSDDAYSQGNHEKPVLKLGGVAKLAGWQTPRGEISGDTAEGHELRQARVVAKHGRRMGTPLEVQAQWVLVSSGLNPIGSIAATISGGQLNPAHSRWLQGYPPEWDVCAVTAMPSSRKSPRSSSPRISRPQEDRAND